jgi:lysine 6-dehydrogenase
VSRLVVLGAGIVGRAAAWDLVRRGHEVVLADADGAASERVAGEVGAVPADPVDAADPDAVAGLAAGAAVLVSAVPYRFGLGLAEAAIDAGAHYLDFGGNPAVVAAQLALDGPARRAGVAVVPDCGLAPGLADLLAVADVASLGDGPVERVALRVGALPASPTGALGYQLTFSPEGLVNEYAELCEVLREGKVAAVEPLTEFEIVEWPEWGPLEAFQTAGGTSTLPHRWAGRVAELDYKTLRYPGHGRVFRALLELGLFDEEPYPVAGVTVAPRAVLVEALRRGLPRGDDDVVLVRTWAAARRDGVPVTAGHQLVDRHDGRFSALARTTAFPATALAHLLATGADGVLGGTGARTMDAAVDPDALVEELRPLGIDVEPYRPPTR